MIPHQPEWMEIAWKEVGTREVAGPGSNPEVEEYHDAVEDDGTPDDVAWCSSFVNWLFSKAGIVGTGSRAARSWLDWGVRTRLPFYGCVCVIWRESPQSWKGHVGLFLGFIGDDVLMLGGNQMNEVSVRRYSKDRVLGYRIPS
jgi:uncharacterized protein (TIGR02594 family)